MACAQTDTVVRGLRGVAGLVGGAGGQKTSANSEHPKRAKQYQYDIMVSGRRTELAHGNLNYIFEPLRLVRRSIVC